MQVLKYQFTSNNKARAAERLLRQVTCKRLGSCILVLIEHPTQVDATINITTMFFAYTISTITDYDLQELFKARDINRKSKNET